MFPWSDVAVVLGVIALAILGSVLGVLHDKVVTSLIVAACGYMGARATLIRMKAKREQRQHREHHAREEGAPESEMSMTSSGVIDIEPQRDGRIVKVRQDGSVCIGPAYQPEPEPERSREEEFSGDDIERTPTDPSKPTGTDGE